MAGSDRAKLKFRMKMQKGKHFRERWNKDPEFMRRMLDITIAKNKERWKAGRERIERIVSLLPMNTHTSKFRELIAWAIADIDGREDVTIKETHRVLVAIRRLNLASFDPGTLTWIRTPKCDNTE